MKNGSGLEKCENEPRRNDKLHFSVYGKIKGHVTSRPSRLNSRFCPFYIHKKMTTASLNISLVYNRTFWS